MGRTHFGGLIAACAALAAMAAPAQAAFVPELTVGLEPPTAGTAPALTATISQPARETEIQRFTLNLPKGFTRIGAPEASACPIAALRLGSCPAASQIGTVDALVGAGVGFKGTIHKGSSSRFVLLVSGLHGAIRQAVAGSLTKRSDSSLDLQLAQLPALAFTRLTLRFDGGGRSLIGTPKRCGDYAIDGKFTSRHDELALARTIVAITGCPGVPAIGVTDIELSRKRFAAGSRTVIRWVASHAADHTNVRVERRADGRWRTLGVLVATGKAGANVLRWDGRLGNRGLRPGRYALRIQPAGSTPSELVPFRII